MNSDWDEIQRLAADFQKAQLSSGSQKLSEINCIEVVRLLIEKEWIDVIFTTDGKEYLTQQQLEQEILDEMYVNGGRVSVVELSKTLNVNFQKIQNVAEKIEKENLDIRFILGQLIDENYLQRIAQEINEKLAQAGEISVSDLTIQYDLPSDFLLKNVMEKFLGTIIIGKQDTTNSRIFFTQSYVARCKSKLRGALAAIRYPTPIAAILSQCNLHERMFFTLSGEISSHGVLTSRTVGAQYIPHIYTKTQSDWVQNFFKQNGYVEYDAVAKLGVSDPKSFIQKQLAGEKLQALQKCTVGHRLIEQVEAALEECLSTNSYLDISTQLPSAMSEEDVDQLMSIILTPAMQKSTLLLGTVLLTNKYLDELVAPCQEIVKENAKKSVDIGAYQQYFAEKQLSSRGHDLDGDEDKRGDKRDERRRKAAGGKTGGGTQGRETKTKSTKKHYRGGGNKNQNQFDSDSDDNTNQGGRVETVSKGKSKESALQLVNEKEIAKILAKSLLEEGLEDLAGLISKHYYSPLEKIALATAEQLYKSSLQNNSSQDKRQTHASLQDQLNNLLNDIRLYEKGLKLFPTDVQPQLIKYLLKSLCSDITNELATYVAHESKLNVAEGVLTTEQRLKIAQECDKEYKLALTALIKTLNGTSIEEFLTASENCLIVCSMILKKIDKKKDRTLILCHKHGLLDQLSNCKDPALVLHLAVLVIFTISTQNMLHCSGRHVSMVLTFLKPSLSPEQMTTLQTYHDLVMKLLSDETKPDEIVSQLEDMAPAVKQVATTYKKAANVVE